MIDDDWPELPDGCVIFMMAGDYPAKTAAERKRAERDRKAYGLDPLTVDVPKRQLVEYLVEEGYVSRGEIDDPNELRAACSQMLREIVGADLSRCDQRSGAAVNHRHEPGDAPDADPASGDVRITG